MILEGLYKSKIAGFCSASDCVGLVRPRTVRNQRQYSRLKTAGRLHIDQAMRARNCRARNEIVERGATSKSEEGKKAYVERKVGECCQWEANRQCSKVEANRQCSKGDSCSFTHDPAPDNRRKNQRGKGQPSSPALIRRQRLTGKNPSTDQAAEVRALGQEGADSRAAIYKSVKTCHVKCIATSAVFDMLRQRRSPTKRSKKGSAKGQVALLKVKT